MERLRRIPIGFFIWLGVVGVSVGGYFALTALFPGQLAAVDQTEALRLLGLLALVSSGLVFLRRFHFGQAARNLAIWGALAAVAVIGYTFRQELIGAFDKVRGELIPAYAVSDAPHTMTITRSDDGGFYVQGQVNGQPVRFAIDTGASGIVLSPADAQRAGADLSKLDFSAPSETANGVGQMAPYIAATLDIGPLRTTNVQVSVDKTPMTASLLGMDFLQRLDSIQIHGDQLTLKWRG